MSKRTMWLERAMELIDEIGLIAMVLMLLWMWSAFMDEKVASGGSKVV